VASGGKAVEISEGFKFYYNGGRLKQNGVGIAVGERFRDDVTEINRVSDRLMSIKINRGTTTIRMERTSTSSSEVTWTVTLVTPENGTNDTMVEKGMASATKNVSTY